jgi:hypothetical protein
MEPPHREQPGLPPPSFPPSEPPGPDPVDEQAAAIVNTVTRAPHEAIDRKVIVPSLIALGTRPFDRWYARASLCRQ